MTSRAGARTGSPDGPVAAGRGPQVDPAPRAIAIRSPRTAEEVAAPPAPGPSKPTEPTGSASTSTRFRTPAVRPSAESSGSAVGRTAAARLAVGMAAGGGEEADHPTRRTRLVGMGSRDRGDAGAGRAAAAVGPGRDRRGIEPAIEREPGEDHQLVDRVEPLDVADGSASAYPRRCASASASS